MQIDLSVRRADGSTRDVRVRAEPDTPVRDVVAALGCAGPVDGDGVLADGVLRHGAVLGDGQGAIQPPSTWQLVVCGGPDAGLVHPLATGRTVVGRAAECDLVLTDPDLSRTHLEVVVSAGSVRVRDLDSTNGSALADTELNGVTDFLPGEVLRLGDTLLRVANGAAVPADTRAMPDGRVLVNPPPVPPADPVRAVIDLPAPPSQAGPARVQLLAAVIPAAGAGALALALGSAMFLLLAVLSPVALLLGAGSDRWHGRRTRRRQVAEYRRAQRVADGWIADGLAAEARTRRDELPDPVAVVATATLPGRRLWERRRGPGLLRVRVGYGRVESRLGSRLDGQVRPAGRVPDVPVPIDLGRGAVGVAGPLETATALARWCVVQLAVAAAPSDLEVVPLVEGPQWRWLRWLPHVRDPVATEAASRRALVRDLLAEAERREQDVGGTGAGWAGPWLLVVLDEAFDTTGVGELSELLARGPAVGITALCVREQETGLPAACVTTLRVGGENGARLMICGVPDAPAGPVVADRVGAAQVETVGRALAPLIDPRELSGWGLPDLCPLEGVLGMPDQGRIAAAWAADTGSADALLGQAAGARLRLDLTTDGPHALVAGTTGSGKSELLRTWVLSLAALHPPGSVSFLLIDYKGGAAFAECAGLPHTAGLVTDLDASLVQRALVSLRAELRRRETLFAASGAADLDSYRGTDPAEPCPRLVIVVDEFAGLVEELPDFVSGLVGIAQRGRSLGIHLILATQRPAGVISAEIRANTALRICLRVTSAGDSAEILDSPLAAGLSPSRPGRAYVRRGEELTPVQVASATHRTDGQRDITVVELDAWRRPVGRAVAPSPPDAGQLPIATWVTAIRGAAEISRAGAGRPLWQPPLPEVLPLAALPAPEGDLVAIGLIDLPAEQRQPSYLLDLAAGGGVLITGGGRSGRTSALLTIAAAAAQARSPDALHVHAIDASGGLADLALLPHTGTVAPPAEYEMVEALLERLEGELATRLSAPGLPAPALLLLVDGWEQFAAAAAERGHGRALELLESLLRSGAAVGLTVVLAGDRGTLAPRVAGAISRRLLLPLADPADYGLAGIAARDVPAHRPAGRALTPEGTQVQLAHLCRGSERADRLARIASQSAPGSGRAPVRLRPLPRELTLAELPPAQVGTLWLGAGGDEAGPIGFPLLGGCRLLVAGPPRSGRSTALRLIAEQCPADVPLVVAAPARSPLARGAARVAARLTPDSSPATLTAVTGRVLLLVDDCEAFLDTDIGDALAALVRRGPPELTVIIAGRSDTLAVTHRGLAAEARRFGCGVLLQPGPLDGELVSAALPPRHRSASASRLPGRGVLVPDPAWFDAAAPDPGLIAVQIARPTGQSVATSASSSWVAYQDSSKPSASSTDSCADSSPTSAASMAAAAAATVCSASRSSMWMDAT